MPTSTHSLSPDSKGSSMPRPTLTPPASLAPLLARLHRARAAAGDHREAGLDEPAAELLRRRRTTGGRPVVRAEPNTAIAGPSSASAPKPSTNSAWIRSTRHGSVCTQSRRAAGVEQPLVGGAPVDLVAALDDRALELGLHDAPPPVSQARSCASQRVDLLDGTCSSCLWASIGSPGPKLTAGTPSPLKRATSVQPNLGLTSPPTASTNASPRARSRPGQRARRGVGQRRRRSRRRTRGRTPRPRPRSGPGRSGS